MVTSEVILDTGYWILDFVLWWYSVYVQLTGWLGDAHARLISIRESRGAMRRHVAIAYTIN